MPFPLRSSRETSVVRYYAASAAPDCEPGDHVEAERRCDDAVDDTVVERDRDVPHAADDDLAAADDRPLRDPVEAEDRDLGVVHERRHEEPAELAGARDGERRVPELLRRERARACAPRRAGSTSARDLLDREALAGADDRDDEAVVGLHGDADVDAVEEHDLVALEARVQLGVTRRARPRRRGSRAARACETSTSVKSHSSTNVTAGISRWARVTCSTIARRIPRIGTRRPSPDRPRTRGRPTPGSARPGRCRVDADELDAELPRELPHGRRGPHGVDRLGRDDRDERLRPALRRLGCPAARPRGGAALPPRRSRRARRRRARPSPSSTRIFSTVPARGDGISTVVLSVCTSTSG